MNWCPRGWCLWPGNSTRTKRLESLHIHHTSFCMHVLPSCPVLCSRTARCGPQSFWLSSLQATRCLVRELLHFVLLYPCLFMCMPGPLMLLRWCTCLPTCIRLCLSNCFGFWKAHGSTLP